MIKTFSFIILAYASTATSYGQTNVHFHADTGTVQAISLTNPLNRLAAGALRFNMSFQSDLVSGEGDYLQPLLRAVWMEKDASGSQIVWEGAPNGWRGVSEYLTATTVNFSSGTGVGLAAVELPLGGNSGVTNFPRAYISDLGTTSLEVVLINARSSLQLNGSNYPTVSLGDIEFDLPLEDPDILLGSATGIRLLVNEQEHPCFIRDFRPGSGGETYVLSGIPASAVTLSDTTAIIGADGWFVFNITAHEPVDFRLQATRSDGVSFVSRLYSIEREIAVLDPPVSGLVSSGSPIGVIMDSRRCKRATTVPVGPEGLAQECARCVPSPTIPQKTCHYSDGSSGGLYHPGDCVLGSGYCQSFLNDSIPTAHFVWVATVPAPCNEQTPGGGFEGSITFAKGWEIGISISPPGTIITTPWITKCCIWSMHSGHPPFNGVGMDCI